jgi:hypothetical protein
VIAVMSSVAKEHLKPKRHKHQEPWDEPLILDSAAK